MYACIQFTNEGIDKRKNFNVTSCLNKATVEAQEEGVFCLEAEAEDGGLRVQPLDPLRAGPGPIPLSAIEEATLFLF
jgi:hypothetical protein